MSGLQQFHSTTNDVLVTVLMQRRVLCPSCYRDLIICFISMTCGAVLLSSFLGIDSKMPVAPCVS